MATPPPPSLTLWTVLTESKRIINAHSRHFLALSLLFLFPVAFSSILYPYLLSHHFPTNSQSFFISSHSTPPQPSNPHLLSLAFFLVLFFLPLLALGSITYSVFHGFYGRPVKLLSAVHSIKISFWPLLGTALAYNVVLALVVIIFSLFLFLVLGGFEMIGLEIELSSPYFLGLFIVVAICFVVVLLYLQVNWTLAWVVSVVEPRWGFDALSRSANLMKGTRGVGASLMVFFGVCGGILGFCSSVYWRREWHVYGGNVVIVVCYSVQVMVAMLYHAAANTVLYMYCKAAHGELALEIAEEFASEYVSLPFDDGKVPHLVSDAYVR